MANEFFIPVGRRYEAALADLDALLDTGTAVYNTNTITWVDAGYAEQNYHGVMTPNGMRVFSRSDLCRPNTRFDPVARIDAYAPGSYGMVVGDLGEMPTGLISAKTNYSVSGSTAIMECVNTDTIKSGGNIARVNVTAGSCGISITSEYNVALSSINLRTTADIFNILINTYDCFQILSNTNIGMGYVVGGFTPKYSLHVNHPKNNSSEIMIENINIHASAFAGFQALANNNNSLQLLATSSIYTDATWRGKCVLNANNTAGTIISQSGIYPIDFYTNNLLRLNISGNGCFGFGTATIDATARNCIAIKNGVIPSGHTDEQIYIFAIDDASGDSTLGLYTERIVDAGSLAVTHYLEVIINGANYAILLNDLEPMGP